MSAVAHFQAGERCFKITQVLEVSMSELGVACPIWLDTGMG